jgi:hypothetical protein
MATQPPRVTPQRHRSPGTDHQHRRRDHRRRIARRCADREAARGRGELSHQSCPERAGGAASNGDGSLTDSRKPREPAPSGWSSFPPSRRGILDESQMSPPERPASASFPEFQTVFQPLVVAREMAMAAYSRFSWPMNVSSARKLASSCAPADCRGARLTASLGEQAAPTRARSVVQRSREIDWNVRSKLVTTARAPERRSITSIRDASRRGRLSAPRLRTPSGPDALDDPVLSPPPGAL